MMMCPDLKVKVTLETCRGCEHYWGLEGDISCKHPDVTWTYVSEQKGGDTHEIRRMAES